MTIYIIIILHLHCKNLLASKVARNSVNCNLISHVGCYGYTCIYNYNDNFLILSIRCMNEP